MISYTKFWRIICMQQWCVENDVLMMVFEFWIEKDNMLINPHHYKCHRSYLKGVYITCAMFAGQEAKNICATRLPINPTAFTRQSISSSSCHHHNYMHSLNHSMNEMSTILLLVNLAFLFFPFLFQKKKVDKFRPWITV